MTQFFKHIALFSSLLISIFSWSMNDFSSTGKRIGYWCLDKNNKAVEKNSVLKVSEGEFKNGRKSGVWVLFYEDGKTTRVVAEYKDNRPNGVFFRFNREGKLHFASSTNDKLKGNVPKEIENTFFACKMNFDDQNVIAGQIFFKTPILAKNSIQFWNAKSIESVNVTSEKKDFSWIDKNYNKLYEVYLAFRNPNNLLSSNIIAQSSRILPASVNSSTVVINSERAPLIRNPRTASGIAFQPNGWNKLYNSENDIWMDGLFKDGQLKDGKVFLYDSDGVLLKVRVFKNTVYTSDGVL